MDGNYVKRKAVRHIGKSGDGGNHEIGAYGT